MKNGQDGGYFSAFARNIEKFDQFRKVHDGDDDEEDGGEEQDRSRRGRTNKVAAGLGVTAVFVGLIIAVGVLAARVRALSNQDSSSSNGNSEISITSDDSSSNITNSTDRTDSSSSVLAIIMNTKANAIVMARGSFTTNSNGTTAPAFEAASEIDGVVTSNGKDLAVAPAEGRLWWTDMTGGPSGANNGAVWTYSFVDGGVTLVTEAGAGYAKPAILALDSRTEARALFYTSQVSVNSSDGYCIRSVSADNNGAGGGNEPARVLWRADDGGHPMGLALDMSHGPRDGGETARLMYTDNILATLGELTVSYGESGPSVRANRVLLKGLDPPPKYISTGHPSPRAAAGTTPDLLMVLQATETKRSAVVAIDLAALRRLPCAQDGGCNASSLDDLPSVASVVVAGDVAGYPDGISPGCRGGVSNLAHSFFWTDKYLDQLSTYVASGAAAGSRAAAQPVVEGLNLPKGFAVLCGGVAGAL